MPKGNVRKFPPAQRFQNGSGRAGRNTWKTEREIGYWLLLGDDLEEEDPVAALDAYRKSADLGCPGAWINMGHLYVDNGALQEARHCFQSALEIDPGNVVTLDNLAYVEESFGNMHRAERLYRNILDLDPEYAEAYYSLALLARRRGECFEAYRHCITYLRLEPAGRYAQEARDVMQRIRQLKVI